MKRQEDLATPRKARRLPSVHYDPEAFGEFSETIARFFGTARFLVIQTIVVIVWIVVNALAWTGQWDPYPYILLNLLFSTQAAYAAPLILLAQNRQEERDRAQVEMDRTIYARTKADTEFLAREIAGIRLGMADVVTNDDLDDRLERINKTLEQIMAKLEGPDPEPQPS